MKKYILSFLLIIIPFLLLSASVPYRIVMPSSTYSAQLRGITGTRTEGITITGSYSSTFKAHVFTVSVEGRYDLYYDASGGSTYTKDTGWSGSYGKFIAVGDFNEAIDTDYDNKVDQIDDNAITTTTILDSNVTLNKFSTAAYNYIGSGGNITNNPDDVTIENSTPTTLGVKDASITTSKLADSSVTSEKIATAVQNEFIPTVADTTALKAKSGSVTKLVHLSEISLSAGVGGGDFVYKASGYTANKVTVFDASGGGYWVRKEWDANRGYVDVSWAGAKDNDSQDNATQIQNALSVSNIKHLHFPQNSSTGIYRTSSGFTFSQNQFIVSGENGTILELTAMTDTLMYVTSNNTFTLRDIQLSGPGKATNTTALYTYTPSGGGRHYINNVWINDFGEGYKNHEITQVVVTNLQVWDCGSGLLVGRQGDVHTYNNFRAADCDTGVVIGWDRNTLGNSPLIFINAFFIRDSLNFMVHDRNHATRVIGYYCENSKQEGLIEAVSGNNIFSINTGHTQEADSGWVVNGGSFTLENMRGTTNANYYVTLTAAPVYFKTAGNIITSGNVVRYNSQSFSTNIDLLFEEEQARVINLNSSTYSTVYPYRYNGYNGNGKLFSRWSRTASTGSSIWDFFIKDYGSSSNYGWVGLSKGYLQTPNNTTANPHASSAALRGSLFGKDGTEATPDDPDSLLLSMYNGSYGTSYDWYDLVRGSFRSYGATAGKNAFSATALHDTVRIVGLEDNSPQRWHVVVTPYTDSPDSSTILSITVKTDSLFVHRPYTSSGALNYTWIWKQIP